MINRMAAIKSDDNQLITLSDEELIGRLDHIDTGIHEIQRDLVAVVAFIDANRDAIAHAKSFLDPGAKLRKMMGGKRDHTA